MTRREQCTCGLLRHGDEDVARGRASKTCFRDYNADAEHICDAMTEARIAILRSLAAELNKMTIPTIGPAGLRERAAKLRRQQRRR